MRAPRSHVRAHRDRLRLSLTELATRVCIRRQSLAASDSDRSVSSRTVALRLSAALTVSVVALVALLGDGLDAAVMVEPVAAAHGLPFLPLSEERFELVLRSRDRSHPGVARLLARLQEASTVREIRAMGAYDTTETGRIRRVGAA